MTPRITNAAGTVNRVYFGRWKWTQAVVDLCLDHECRGDNSRLFENLMTQYSIYRHPNSTKVASCPPPP